MDKSEYSDYVSDNSGLGMRIYDSIKTADSLETLYSLAKSKNYTHSRVRREVLNLYLKVKREYSENIPPYIKVLAVSEKGLDLLSKAKENTDLPIITKHSEAKKLTGKAREMILCAVRRQEIANVYRIIRETDEDAFTLICEAGEIIGEGFKK